jgi:glycosyltransferase involved in cell wall biosynthesis
VTRPARLAAAHEWQTGGTVLELTLAISADYARATGGWVYNQRLLDGLARLGWHIHRVTLPAGFPNPSFAARAEAAAAFHGIADGRLVLVDQLCLGVLPEVARAEAQRLRLVMIVHHPLALENDRAPGESLAYAKAEREALRHVAAAIATSATTAQLLAADYGVPAERIIIATPGVDRAPLARGGGGPMPNLLTVGAVVPRKDHDSLISALMGLRHLPWRLAIVGNTSRAPAHVARLCTQLVASGLSSRVTITGELAAGALARHWRTADVYVAASRHEGYGMAIAEAFAHGLPVVTTEAGAVGAWIGHRGALVVPTGNVPQLRAALADVLTKPSLRARLRRAALARRHALPTWEATAEVVDSVLLRLP